LSQQKNKIRTYLYKDSLNMSEFSIFTKKTPLKNIFFKNLAKINKIVFPSFSKRRLDLSKANKIQLAILAWRIYVTKRALD